MAMTRCMSWEGGVDLVAVTAPGLEMPNVIVHVARMVHTPVGSAPAGIVLWQPDPAAAPVVCGFVSSDPAVAAYFGPNIFAGTPFEHAPALDAKIEITSGPDSCSARVEVGGQPVREPDRDAGQFREVELPLASLARASLVRDRGIERGAIGGRGARAGAGAGEHEEGEEGGTHRGKPALRADLFYRAPPRG